MQTLKKLLNQIDGKGYKAYKQIKGTYQFQQYALRFDHIQGDPFAAPSRISLIVPMEVGAFPTELRNEPIRKTALEDFLRRTVARSINRNVKGRRGSGKSGQVAIETGGQQVLVRNAIIITPGYIEARMTVGLPASGRNVSGREAETIFFSELPLVVQQSLLYANLPAKEIKHHVNTVEDQDFLRAQLEQKDLVAFISNGAILPRRSGIDDHPLAQDAIPFKSPDSLSYEFDLPNAGTIRGMGIPKGVTLIVGGGFHGKSTLLHALERGVYNHIPGDGRECVVTDPTAVKIRAEDGRAIFNVNICPFINNLPFGRDTLSFFTENASGSTSQAANIIEALDCGAKTLLIDEDTSATNFMIRDERMQSLVRKDKEPITPFLFRVRELYEQHGTSTVIVMGGSGDYFDVADTVIMMDSYEPKDVTLETKKLARNLYREEIDTGVIRISKRDSRRKPRTRSLDPSRGKRDIKIDAKDVDFLLYGENIIDLSKVEQLIDIAQTRAIGWFIYSLYSRYGEQADNLITGLEDSFRVVSEKGLDELIPYKTGNLAMPRLFEVAATINRLRATKW
jgi:predicted ABC-class ATPase